MVPAGDEQTLYTVESGKRFVILKLFGSGPGLWSLKVNDQIIINGLDGFAVDEVFAWDFPDRCVVAEAGETIKLVNDHGFQRVQVNIAGYFYEVP